MKTLKSLRLHISILGRTNVGKSSLLNSITNQQVSIVSDKSGTTTDVVEKSFELFPVGPVTFLDTAGIDDESELSELRIQKTMNVLNRSDIAVIVTDYNGFSDYEISLISKLKSLDIPFIVVVNKSDIFPIASVKLDKIKTYTNNILQTTSVNNPSITGDFISLLIKSIPDDFINVPSIIGDKLSESDVVVLVTPIDKEAPKGRLILPQVQTIRDILDNKCISVVTQVENLQKSLDMLSVKPKLVVTDSQAFKEVAQIVPNNIPLTSFSILFARLKGDLKEFLIGVKTIETLSSKDKILILESCSHHAIDDDIATVKIPKLLEKKLGFKPIIEYKSGHDFPDVSPYKLIIHCGACMTNRKEILSRILISKRLGVPITNYGVVISYCLGILNRAVQIFQYE